MGVGERMDFGGFFVREYRRSKKKLGKPHSANLRTLGTTPTMLGTTPTTLGVRYPLLMIEGQGAQP